MQCFARRARPQGSKAQGPSALMPVHEAPVPYVFFSRIPGRQASTPFSMRSMPSYLEAGRGRRPCAPLQSAVTIRRRGKDDPLFLAMRQPPTELRERERRQAEGRGQRVMRVMRGKGAERTLRSSPFLGSFMNVGGTRTRALAFPFAILGSAAVEAPSHGQE